MKVCDEDFPRHKLLKASKPFVAFLDKCLEKDPKQRPSVGEILQGEWLRAGELEYDFDDS